MTHKTCKVAAIFLWRSSWLTHAYLFGLTGDEADREADLVSGAASDRFSL